MDFHATLQSIPWTIRTDAPVFGWPPRLSIATSWSGLRLSLFEPGIVPDARSLAHEFFHIVNTNDPHYAVSKAADWVTLGKVIQSPYWKNQEIGANMYGELHKNDPVFQAIVAQIRAKYPGLPDGDITHPV